MKKALLIFSCFIFSTIVFAQQSEYSYHPKKGEKYFIGLGYGLGTSHWNSVFKNTQFYDKDGSVIKSGDFKFQANSPTKHYDINVMVPIKRIRFGMGISFEYQYLSQLKIYSSNGDEFLIFDEGMRFDKIYLQAEVPFNFDTKKKYTMSWSFKAGSFGYTYVNRFNFLGDKPFPISILAAAGVVIDYEIYPQIYAFVLPNLEYKFYDNSHTDTPVQIIHNVFTASILAGIRVDLGKFYF